MYYKIKKDKRSKNFLVTHQKFRDDPFKFEVSANRVLQFDSALLVYDGEKYSLYLTSSTNPTEPTFIIAGISQYRVFRNSVGHKNCILALQINDFWIFLVPEDFRYFINTVKIFIGRLETLPKLFVTDSTLPAYFKKGFEDTLVFIFHANGKDYLIFPKSFDITGTAAQIRITEFAGITLLPPEGYFKAVSETKEHLFHHSVSYGDYVSLESFSEKDYPEVFSPQNYYGYWGKDADGNTLDMHLTDSNGNNYYGMKFKKPVKTVHFFSRTYTDTVNGYYYDIWQITYVDGQKQLEIKPHGYGHFHPTIDEDAWKF